MPEEATKSTSSNRYGKASKATKIATTDDEGRKLTNCLDRALHGRVGGIGGMADATLADCTALQPLALKLAKFKVQLQALCSTIQEDWAHGKGW